MTCPFCKSPIAENSNFCEICGQNITREDLLRQKEKEKEKDFNVTEVKEFEIAEKKNINPQKIRSAHIQLPKKIDEGEKDAKASFFCGIISIFTGPIGIIPAAISLFKAKQYKLFGNGDNKKKVKTGTILSLITIIAWVVCLAVFAITGILAPKNNDDIDKNPLFNIEEESKEYAGNLWNPNKNNTSEKPSSLIPQTEITTSVSLYSKEIPNGGEVVYKQKDATVTLFGMELKTNGTSNTFTVTYSLKSDDDYELKTIKVNGKEIEDFNSVGFNLTPGIVTFDVENILSMNDVKKITFICSTDENSAKAKEISFDIY